MSREGRFTRIVKTHDEKVWFFLLYFVVGFALSYFLNLGFFLLLTVVHFAVDLAKHRLYGDSWKRCFAQSTREAIVDVAFFFIGLTLGLYAHVAVTVGIANAGRALTAARATRLARVGQIAARSTTATRTIETASKIYLKTNEHKEFVSTHGPFTRIEWASVAILAFCVSLLIASPWLIQANGELFVTFLKENLIPRF